MSNQGYLTTASQQLAARQMSKYTYPNTVRLFTHDVNTRSDEMYENSFDEIMRHMGGVRLKDMYPNIQGRNSDYYISDLGLVVELKCRRNTTDFNDVIKKDRLEYLKLNGGRIIPVKLDDWTHLAASKLMFESFKPIARRLREGDSQNRATQDFLVANGHAVNECALIVVNCNDESFTPGMFSGGFGHCLSRFQKAGWISTSRVFSYVTMDYILKDSFGDRKHGFTLTSAFYEKECSQDKMNNLEILVNEYDKRLHISASHVFHTSSIECGRDGVVDHECSLPAVNDYHDWEFTGEKVHYST